jgi:MoxR-like ATPase
MTVNAMRVSAGDALAVLLAGWEAQKAGRMRASFMLHGRPGVGKTQVVEDLARRIDAQFFDLRLTTIEPQDLRGLPYYDHSAKKTLWYRPEDLPDDPARPAVLFLDELTAASPYLQPTVYGLLQERRVGQHRLPDSVFLVAAGNTVEDGAIAYEMGTGLSDRLVHLMVEASAEDWLRNFAVPKGLHPAVIAFIRTRPDLLETTEEALARGEMIAATPRSWERVSQIVSSVPDRRLRNMMVAGTVGEAIGADFALVADEIAATVRVDEMIAARGAERLALYPETLHGLAALVYGLVGALDPATAPEVIAIMADIRTLDRLRPGEGYGALPLTELCTHGFELLIAKGLDAGLEQAFLDHPSYAAYAAERRAAGLD